MPRFVADFLPLDGNSFFDMTGEMPPQLRVHLNVPPEFEESYFKYNASGSDIEKRTYFENQDKLKDILIERYRHPVTQQLHKMRQGKNLGSIGVHNRIIEVDFGVTMQYASLWGREYVTLTFSESLVRRILEKLGKTEDDLLCMMVTFDDKVAAIPMKRAAGGSFNPIYVKKLKQPIGIGLESCGQVPVGGGKQSIAVCPFTYPGGEVKFDLGPRLMMFPNMSQKKTAPAANNDPIMVDVSGTLATAGSNYNYNMQTGEITEIEGTGSPSTWTILADGTRVTYHGGSVPFGYPAPTPVGTTSSEQEELLDQMFPDGWAEGYVWAGYNMSGDPVVGGAALITNGNINHLYPYSFSNSGSVPLSNQSGSGFSDVTWSVSISAFNSSYTEVGGSVTPQPNFNELERIVSYLNTEDFGVIEEHVTNIYWGSETRGDNDQATLTVGGETITGREGTFYSYGTAPNVYSITFNFPSGNENGYGDRFGRMPNQGSEENPMILVSKDGVPLLTYPPGGTVTVDMGGDPPVSITYSASGDAPRNITVITNTSYRTTPYEGLFSILFPHGYNGNVYRGRISRPADALPGAQPTTTITTPYETVSYQGSPNFKATTHISNKDIIIQGYEIDNEPRLFLNGSQITDSLPEAIGTSYGNLSGIVLDVPLKVIKKIP